MALIEPRHCGRPERHDPHRGRCMTHMGGHPVICHGDPKELAGQQWVEANPPPGPPSIPRRYEWEVVNGG